jgi:ribosomal protein S18 acetylase RimI-like enzyme
MHNMKLIFRRAEAGDLDPLRALSISSFTTAYARFNTAENMRNYLSENFSEEKLSQEIRDGQILVGIQNNKMVAYAKLVKPDATKIPGSNPLEIARLYTDTQLIGQGIGVEMINAISAEALNRGCDAICLDVWQQNYRAINFYQREGFTIFGTTRFVLGDDVQDDFIMFRKLKCPET